MREYAIGERVECEGHRGTVLFIGEVPPTKGAWLGVEWDNPTRGKHDGSHEGIKYFETSHPNAGSFVRTNKIKPTKMFFQALSERYRENSTCGFADECLISSLKNDMNAPFLELVGFEKIGQKQSKLSELTIAVLNNMCINYSENNLQELCPNIEELDLSSNLFNSWSQIADIARQLSSLQILNVSDNKLVIPDNTCLLEFAFKNLIQLRMSSMEYTWKDVIQCSLMCPQLQCLSVPNNRIAQLEFMNNDLFCELRELNLERNHIPLWEEINKLGNLPNLEILSLHGTGLKNIQVKENSFRKLTKLNISNNQICQWHHVSELDKLPMLIDLKFCGNLLPEGDTFLECVTARIENLQILNKTQINLEDRRKAELDYIRHNWKAYLSASVLESELINDQIQRFKTLHPRYLQLLQKYEQEERREFDFKSVSLKDALITLKLAYLKTTITKKVPPSMQIQKLKTLCHRLFNLDNSEISLYFTCSENPDLVLPLDNDFRPIAFYSLENDDTIIITELA